jgi:mRNA interferase RelE/StbE
MPAWTVEYHVKVLNDDFPLIPRNLQQRIVRAVEARLMTEPTKYGQRLRRSLFGLWKLRVGDYRVVYEITGHRVIVRAIRNRREVYDLIVTRLGRA